MESVAVAPAPSQGIRSDMGVRLSSESRAIEGRQSHRGGPGLARGGGAARVIIGCQFVGATSRFLSGGHRDISLTDATYRDASPVSPRYRSRYWGRIASFGCTVAAVGREMLTMSRWSYSTSRPRKTSGLFCSFSLICCMTTSTISGAREHKHEMRTKNARNSVATFFTSATRSPVCHR